MDIKEMEENGTIDYYLILKKYIISFINNNYPLSQDDLRSIVENEPTKNVLQRQETYNILNEAMKECLKEVADRNNQIIMGANEGKYTPFTIDDFNKELFQIQQKMLEELWKAKNPEEKMLYEEGKQAADPDISLQEQFDKVEGQEEQLYTQESENEKAQVEHIGERLVEEVVEQSEKIGIGSNEISEVNGEINQTEKDFVQQQKHQNMGTSIGE